MGLTAAVVTGLLLGLSSGGHCFWSCAAVMGPYLVNTDETPLAGRWSTVGPAFRVLGWYNLGRLVAYLAVGVLVSLLAGTRVPPPVHAAALLATALLLALALVRPAGGRHACVMRSSRRRAGALVIGLLQGVSPCPPFLVAIGLALGASRMLYGTLLFLALFVGTALYTLPLAFLEPLRRRSWLMWASRAVGLVVAVYLVLQALQALRG